MTASPAVAPVQDATYPHAVQRYVEHVMGMPVNLALRGAHRHNSRSVDAWAAAMAELRWVDMVFSRYRADSCISRRGRGELTVAECPPEVAEVLELGAVASEQSSGAFSVHRRDAHGRRILDTDGVVKGTAVERAAVHLRRRLPRTDFCMSAGGDLVCFTADADADPWRIGIEHPLDPTRLVAVVPVTRGAVATSGTAHRGQHIVDARTGEAPTGVGSVTAVAASLTEADIDATAAYAQGLDAARWLGSRPRRSGLVVWADGTATPVG